MTNSLDPESYWLAPWEKTQGSARLSRQHIVMPLFSPRPRKRNNKKDKHMIAESEGVEGIGNCSFPGSPSGTKSTSFLTLAVQASFIYM